MKRFLSYPGAARLLVGLVMGLTGCLSILVLKIPRLPEQPRMFFGFVLVISLLGSLTIVGGFFRLLTYFAVRSPADGAKGSSYLDFSQPLMKQPLKVQGFRLLLGGVLAAFLAILGTVMLARPDLPELPRMICSRFQFIGLIGIVLIPVGACCFALHFARLIVRPVLRRFGLRVDTNERTMGPCRRRCL
ncbi:MAG: hypothetical protein JO308_05700 [Verrucomicrobia bacterium]|nr:hypothetical protein [Verrucomicrobiota bacterium]